MQTPQSCGIRARLQAHCSVLPQLSRCTRFHVVWNIIRLIEQLPFELRNRTPPVLHILHLHSKGEITLTVRQTQKAWGMEYTGQ